MSFLKKAASILFHRTALVALLLILQLVVLVVMMVRFSGYFIYFYVFCVLLSIVVVLGIVNSRSDPGFKIAWIVPILLLPVFGGLVYLLCGGNQLPKRVQKKMQGMDRRMNDVLSPDFKAETLAPMGEDAVNQSRYLEKYARCPLYRGTATQYFSLGDYAFPQMLEELRKAEHYIFLEYFIIEPGAFWDPILAVLEEKARAGVDVRVLYDDVGSLYTLP
ncbi:MAG: PLDc N-terminal domain-containing protein, partial [Pseudoflavonifractor sp.]